jgi:hypothetical protein
LTVSDGLATSAPASVVITVNHVNRAPVASAGVNQTVNERTTVTLHGSATDPDGDAPLALAWTAPPGITLDDPTAAEPTFVAPDVGPEGQSFTFTLVARDPSGADSAPASVAITVANVNRAPVANAGPDRTVRSGTIVTLSGSGTDPDGDAIAAFRWTAPAGITLSDPASPTPTFTAPHVAIEASYTFSLVVTDALGLQSAPDSVVITVRRRNLVAAGRE